MTEPSSDKDASPAAPDAAGDATSAAPRRGLFRKRTPAPTPPTTVDEMPADRDVVAELSAEDAASGAADDDGSGGRATRPGVLRRRRRKILGQYEQGIFDLGGLALELHRRGLLAEDVMRRRAAEVADLRGQVDRLDEQLEDIRSDRAERRQSGRGGSRTCPACGARVKASSKFCSECGVALAPADGEAAAAAGPPDGGDQPTQVIADPTAQATQVIAVSAQETAVLPPVKVDE